jgi:flotillin
VTPVYLIVGGLVLVMILSLLVAATLYRKVPPNFAMIIYGMGGPKVVKGGGAIVIPIVQAANELSLELMSFDVVPTQDFFTVQGVAVSVEAVAQIKVKSDETSILTAAEQFLSKPVAERHTLLKLVLEGHLRGIVGQLTVEQIVKEPERIAERLRSDVADDLTKMGLEVVSFGVKEIKDKNAYIENMGRPDIERIRRDADIAAAEARRDTEVSRADAERTAAVARAGAAQETKLAETNSLAKQAEAERDLNLKKASFDAETNKAKAAADKAYAIQEAVQEQQVVAEQAKTRQAQAEGEVKVQEATIALREKELMATVVKPAEAKKFEAEMLAEAKRRQLEIEAEGHATAIRKQGLAEAEIHRARGEAEALVIRAKGEAEADVRRLMAEAYQQYNQAAILERLIPILPEIVRAAAEPLAKVDRITMLSTGNGSEVGVNKLMNEVAKAVVQGPAIIEGLLGIDIKQLMQSIPALQGVVKKTEEPEQPAE